MKTVVHQCKNSDMVKLSRVIEVSVVRGCKQVKIENGSIKTEFYRQGESRQDNWLKSDIDFGVFGINSWRFSRLPAECRDR